MKKMNSTVVSWRDGIYIDENLNLYFGPDLINTKVRACNPSGYYLKSYNLYRNSIKVKSNIFAITTQYALDKDGNIFDLCTLAAGCKNIIENSLDIPLADIYQCHLQFWTDGLHLNKNIRRKTMLLTLWCFIEYKPRLPKLVLFKIFSQVY